MRRSPKGTVNRPAAPRRIAVCLALPMAFALLPAVVQANEDWRVGGDIRSGFLASETRSRSGDTSSNDSVRVRTRFHLRGDLGNDWHFGGRVAALLDTRQDDEKFWLRTHAPGAGGLQTGQATIDEFYLDYRPVDSPWALRVGRFQAAFGLADVMKKSLDQNDSPNFDITWTDGAWLQYRSPDWTTHLILRHNDHRGPTGALRPPLNFADSGSRAGMFLAVESDTAIGPLVQRMVTLTWLPSALRPLGVADPDKDDYLSVTTKVAAQWPLGGSGAKLRLGAELGYAANTPRRETVGSGTGDADSLAWQTSFNVIDIVPDHDLGVVYGRVADGWLLSSDFRPNDSLVEARWVWRISPAWQADARLRHRKEIDIPDSAQRSRSDDDLYLRVTWKF